MALSMFYLGKNSYRNISLILKTTFISRFIIPPVAISVLNLLHCLTICVFKDLNSDEWHVDETVVKVVGVKHYIWFIIDSETRFVIGFHL